AYGFAGYFFDPVGFDNIAGFAFDNLFFGSGSKGGIGNVFRWGGNRSGSEGLDIISDISRRIAEQLNSQLVVLHPGMNEKVAPGRIFEAEIDISPRKRGIQTFSNVAHGQRVIASLH